MRGYWIAFTTFVVRAYDDVVRYFFLTVAPSAVMTALYFVIFGELIGRRVGSVDGFEYRQYIAPGLIMMPIITTAYSHAALSFFIARMKKFLDEQLIAPLPGWIIVVSYVAGGVIRGVLVGVIVGAVALLFMRSPVQHFSLMIGALLLTALIASLAGFINGVFVTTFEQANWVPAFVLTPLTYLGGVFYSLASLPAWAQRLSLANPIFYLVNVFRYGMLGVSDVPVGVAVSIMLLAVVGLFGIAAILMERGTRIRE
jgi:ABC-2 type transport system permease protein